MRNVNLTDDEIKSFQDLNNLNLSDYTIAELKRIASRKVNGWYEEDIGEYLRVAGLITVEEEDRLNRDGRINHTCFFHKDGRPSMSIYTKKHYSNRYSFVICGCIGHHVNFYNLRQCIEGKYNRTSFNKQTTSNKFTLLKNRAVHSNESLVQQAINTYHQSLFDKSNDSMKAIDYLVSRGINKESIIRHKIGLAKNNVFKESLINDFTAIEKAKEIGLLNKYAYDTLNNRITIKYSFNSLAGRNTDFLEAYAPDGKVPCKYINLRNSDTFNKSNELFNYDNLDDETCRTDGVWLCEGYFDAISFSQYLVSTGEKINVCASITSNLSEGQARLLKLKTDIVFLTLDSDYYGQKGSLRAIENLVEAGFKASNIRIVKLSKSKDLADFFNNEAIISNTLERTEYNKKLVYEELSKDISSIEFLIKYRNNQYKNKEITYEEYNNLIKEILFKFVEDVNEYDFYLKMLLA